MITKEIAAAVWTAYNEIEQANKMVEELKKSLNDKGEFEITDNWGNSRGLELHIPTSMSGAKIKRVPFELAIDVIEKHVQAQQTELLRLETICKLLLMPPK
jgi:hypothetical protein